MIRVSSADPRIVSQIRRASSTGSGLLVALGIVVLAGWAIDIPFLKSVDPSFATMKPNSALLFVLLGSALWLASKDKAPRTRRCLAAVVAIVAVATGAQYLSGTSLGIDEALFRDTGDPQLAVPGRMAPLSVLIFLLLGLSFLGQEGRGFPSRLAFALVSTPALVSFMSLLGYLFGAASIYAVGAYTSIALHTSGGFLLACFCLLAARPANIFMELIASATAAGTLLRRLVPATTLILVSLGWIGLRGQTAGFYDSPFGVALLVASSTILLCGLMFLVARTLHDGELERRQAAEQFRLATDSAPTGMLMIDRAGKIVLVNAQIEKLFGYAREELLGQSLEVLVPSRFRDGHPAHRSGFFAHPTTRSMGGGRDLFGLRKDGAEVPIEIGLSPLRTPEGDFVLGSVADITERKRAEQEKEDLLGQLRSLNAALEERVRVRTSELTGALKEREVLLQEIHHRVKNNLQVISSLINMQVRQLQGSAGRAALEECQSRVQTIALIHQKLYQSGDYSRVPFSDYSKSLATNIFQASGISSAIVLDVKMDDVPLAVDKAIPCGLILNELITNALKHGFPAGRSGTVCVGLHAPDGATLVLSVADDGIGMPSESDPATAKTLGLHLVTTLVEQLDGRLDVLHRDGTEFRITFPSGAQTS